MMTKYCAGETDGLERSGENTKNRHKTLDNREAQQQKNSPGDWTESSVVLNTTNRTIENWRIIEYKKRNEMNIRHT